MKQITRVTLETMRMDDLPRVLAIEHQSFRTPWPRDAYTHELNENRLASYLVAKTEEAIVGYAGMWVILDEAAKGTTAITTRTPS